MSADLHLLRGKTHSSGVGVQTFIGLTMLACDLCGLTKASNCSLSSIWNVVYVLNLLTC